MILNKTLNNYIKELPLWGTASFAAGATLAYILLTGNKDTWSRYDVPFVFLGALISVVYVIYISPGGTIREHFDGDKRNEEEKLINILLIKYRSIFIMFLFPCIFLSAYIYTGLPYFLVNSNISFDATVGSLLASTLICAFMSNGSKYFSTWWNIKRNWKKEFGKN